MAQRTWMMTGTFREQFHELEPVGDEVTRYLKRLREHVEGQVRYLVCYERHKSGAWHVHLLVHTPRSASWNQVTDSWQAGFFKANLANVQSAGYLTKYVTKALDDPGKRRPRIRASRAPRYGDAVMIHEAEIVQALKDRRIDTSSTWRTNLKELIRVSEPKAGDPLWDLAIAIQARKYKQLMEVK